MTKLMRPYQPLAVECAGKFAEERCRVLPCEISISVYLSILFVCKPTYCHGCLTQGTPLKTQSDFLRTTPRRCLFSPGLTEGDLFPESITQHRTPKGRFLGSVLGMDQLVFVFQEAGSRRVASRESYTLVLN